MNTFTVTRNDILDVEVYSDDHDSLLNQMSHHLMSARQWYSTSKKMLSIDRITNGGPDDHMVRFKVRGNVKAIYDKKETLEVKLVEYTGPLTSKDRQTLLSWLDR